MSEETERIPADDSSDRLSELLSSVQAALEAEEDITLEQFDDRGESGSTRVAEHAGAAREFVDSNDPRTVLSALGLDELPDGSEPDSIPEAFARASEPQLRELRALIALARLGSVADEGSEPESEETTAGLEEALTELRETLGERARESAGDSEDSDSSALESTVQSLTGTSATEFSEELRSLQTRLEEIRDDRRTRGEQSEEDDERDDDREDEPADGGQTANQDEGGLVDSLNLGDQSGENGSSTGRSTMYSTMPSSNRPDMNAVARPSTMPDRN
ncbi:hypothetical protein EL22_02770 [Halostagnicola sp. A56]|uniref:hypothetical protein n=1 Tax=Halostagnicola sp. A56 TaxID=1495067 RepID=UPI0004A09FF9|nr:hypothetical protein [Halostagnicola sp. A56]KDE58731.1 hypothetical protein EL22_02770 [Halostagnicola sp. A56]